MRLGVVPAVAGLLAAGCGVGGSSEEIADAVHSSIKTNDVITLLVFVRDGEVVKAFDQGNGDGYFHCVGTQAYTPSEAVFRVRRSEGLDFVLSERPPRWCRS